MPKAVWRGMVIAESDDTVVVEGNHYFPRASLKDELLQPSSSTSHCPWKGDASYYTLQSAEGTSPDAVWYYPDPLSAAEQIRDRVAFWKDVQVID
jgi:uncharacterized protein (DUF427 family)